jgi:hypothetical protein
VITMPRISAAQQLHNHFAFTLIRKDALILNF